MKHCICLLFCLMGFTAAAAEREILIADFEGDNFGDWTVSGEAFGPGPAKGTLPNQMEVSGFLGKGLVNSYYGGDAATGRLVSTPFRIELPYLCFLIGGGMHADKACINLVVDGKVVRTATGPNDRPGGSERLDWFSWDVQDLAGKEAVIQIVDEERGGWGHINIDQIVQSSAKRGSAPAKREIVVKNRYLHLPVTSGGGKCWMRLLTDGQCEREFEIELSPDNPGLWAPVEVSALAGKTITVEVDRLAYGSKGLELIRQSDELPDQATAYREPLRPQFHFTSRFGWHNDPNGLVFYRGVYHLFYQHNPYGTAWGNMTWGHATSEDLVHWTECPDAIHPDRLGTIFSGSAIVDRQNTAGWKTGDDDPIVCFYTAAGSLVRPPVPFTQAIAYSQDGGRTWTKYEGNPVIENIIGSNRDPKVFWYEPTRQWIMALFLDGQQYALFASENLKRWQRLCDIPDPGGSECPDMFELPVDGDRTQRRWVFWAANGNYLIGTFDGKAFHKESGPHVARFGKHDYAAQTYSDIPETDGRRIQISWMAGGQYPEMPFNQQMTAPRVLTLRNTSDGVRLFIEPVRELETLRRNKQEWTGEAIQPGEDLLKGTEGELFDIEAEIDMASAEKVTLDVRGNKIEYSAKEKQLTALGATAPLPLVNGRLQMRVLVDRTSVEVFASHGRVSMATCFVPDPENRRMSLTADGGNATAVKVTVWQLKSIWP